MRVVVHVPGLRVTSSQNAREHWARKARRVRGERLAVRLALAGVPAADRLSLAACPRVHVRLVRLAPRRLDRDNNVSGFKGVLDEVCSWLGRSDGDEAAVGVEWGQEAAKGYGVRIELTGETQ